MFLDILFDLAGQDVYAVVYADSTRASVLVGGSYTVAPPDPWADGTATLTEQGGRPVRYQLADPPAGFSGAGIAAVYVRVGGSRASTDPEIATVDVTTAAPPPPPPPADPAAAIAAAVAGPQSVAMPDGRSATARPIPDLIAADKHLAAKTAAAAGRGGWAGLGRSRAVLPGAA